MKGHKAHHHGVAHDGHRDGYHHPHHEHPKAEHKRARGGKVGNEPLKGVPEYKEDKAPKEVYAGKGSNDVKEAESKSSEPAQKRKHGGAAKHHEGKVHGKMAHMHLGRPGRKKGGRVGSDQSPLSSAATVKEAESHDADSGC